MDEVLDTTFLSIVSDGCHLVLRAHRLQLPKMKKYVPHGSLHKIYRLEAVGLSISNYISKIKIFVSM